MYRSPRTRDPKAGWRGKSARIIAHQSPPGTRRGCKASIISVAGTADHGAWSGWVKAIWGGNVLAEVGVCFMGVVRCDAAAGGRRAHVLGSATASALWLLVHALSSTSGCARRGRVGGNSRVPLSRSACLASWYPGQPRSPGSRYPLLLQRLLPVGLLSAHHAPAHPTAHNHPLIRANAAMHAYSPCVWHLLFYLSSHLACHFFSNSPRPALHDRRTSSRGTCAKSHVLRVRAPPPPSRRGGRDLRTEAKSSSPSSPFLSLPPSPLAFQFSSHCKRTPTQARTRGWVQRYRRRFSHSHTCSLVVVRLSCCALHRVSRGQAATGRAACGTHRLTRSGRVRQKSRGCVFKFSDFAVNTLKIALKNVN